MLGRDSPLSERLQTTPGLVLLLGWLAVYFVHLLSCVHIAVCVTNSVSEFIGWENWVSLQFCCPVVPSTVLGKVRLTGFDLAGLVCLSPTGLQFAKFICISTPNCLFQVKQFL